MNNTSLLKKITEQATALKQDGAKHFDNAKFAKLLIEEVVNLLDKSDPGFNSYSKRVIAEHFGVKV